MHKQHTAEDLVNYVWKNRRGGAFTKGFKTIDDVKHEVMQALNDNCLGFVTDDKTGEIIGVATGTVYPEDKTFYCKNALVTKKGALWGLIRVLCNMYPTYKLEARRHGKKHQFNKSKVFPLIYNLTAKGII